MAALVGLGYLLLRNQPELAPGAFADDGVYLGLGKALAAGDGYRSVYAPGALPHGKYPPGLPLLHAALWRLGGALPGVWALAGWLSLTATAAAGGLLWWLGRGRLRLPALPLLVLGICPLLLEGSVQYLQLPVSEPVFLLLAAAALVVWPAAATGTTAALATGALLGAAALTRSQGLLLVGGLLLVFPWRAAGVRRAAALVGAGLAVLLAGVGIRTADAGPARPVEPDELSYLSAGFGGVGEALASAPGTVIANGMAYAEALSRHLAGPPFVGGLLLVAFGGLILVGLPVVARRHVGLVTAVAGLGGILLVWPYAQDRFALVLLPLLGLLAAAGVERLAPREREGRAAAAFVVLLVVTAGVAHHQATLRRTVLEAPPEEAPRWHPAWFLRENTRYLASASAWLAEHARPDDRLLAPLPAGLFLLTGLPGANATPFEARGRALFDVPGRYLAERIRDQAPTLLLLWGSTYPITRDAALLQSSCPDVLRYEGSTGPPLQVAVFRVVPDSCFSEWARTLERSGA